MIPDFQTIMLPLLCFAGDGQEHSIREAYERLATEFGLTSQELEDLIPSGKQTIFSNRVSWASTHLKKAGLLESPKRGYFRITPRGREVLSNEPKEINIGFLNQYPEFREFRKSKSGSSATDVSADQGEERTPEEILDSAYQEIRDALAQDLLQQIQACSDSFFERLVVEVLFAMGYGGSRREAARAVGRAGDEGIDGIIDEDRLGLETIYIQAKKWKDTVTRPEVQKFVGALTGQRARKGVFITTSRFTDGAYDYVSNIETKVVLIDGQKLAAYMMDYNVGVSTVDTYEIKHVDSDYFDKQLP